MSESISKMIHRESWSNFLTQYQESVEETARLLTATRFHAWGYLVADLVPAGHGEIIRRVADAWLLEGFKTWFPRTDEEGLTAMRYMAENGVMEETVTIFCDEDTEVWTGDDYTQVTEELKQRLWGEYVDDLQKYDPYGRRISYEDAVASNLITVQYAFTIKMVLGKPPGCF